jgi:hypothetical protein
MPAGRPRVSPPPRKGLGFLDAASKEKEKEKHATVNNQIKLDKYHLFTSRTFRGLWCLISILTMSLRTCTIVSVATPLWFNVFSF